MTEIFDDEYDYDEYDDIYKNADEDFAIELGKEYRTLDNEKAVPMYILTIRDSYIIYGHVVTKGDSNTIPLAVQWHLDGTVYDSMNDRSFNIVSEWSEPITYLRHVYIHKTSKGLKTSILDEPKTKWPTDWALVAYQAVRLKSHA